MAARPPVSETRNQEPNVSTLPPGPGESGDTSRPAYVIEIDISPQLRERHPERPLSLREALETGRPAPQVRAARGPQTDLSGEAGTTWAGSQLRSNLRHVGGGLADQLHAAGSGDPAGDAEPAGAVRSVECACTALPGVPCGPSGDDLARYLRAEQRFAISRQTLIQVIAGLDVISPLMLIRPASRDATPAPDGPAAGQAIRPRLAARMNPHPAQSPGETTPAVIRRQARELEAGT
jgi:hypothetical protein